MSSVIQYQYLLCRETPLFTVIGLPQAEGKYPTVIFRTPYVDSEVEKTEESIELGYVVSPKYKGNGYCTMALEQSINYLFSRGFKEIICGAFEHNLASIRVMQKAGMTKISKVDQIEYRGKVHTCIYYSIVI